MQLFANYFNKEILSELKIFLLFPKLRQLHELGVEHLSIAHIKLKVF